jgi:uncharacterized membrane protein
VQPKLNFGKYNDMSLRRFALFRTKPPKGFDYKPLYYDEEKERKEELKKKLETPDEARDELLRIQVRKNWSRLRTTQRQKGSSPVMLLMIIVLLALVSWWILFS